MSEQRRDEAETGYKPLTDHELDVAHTSLARIEAIGEAITSWTHKADARETGATVHFKFERRADVFTALEFVTVMNGSVPMLGPVYRRLLAADTEVARLREQVATEDPS